MKIHPEPVLSDSPIVTSNYTPANLHLSGACIESHRAQIRLSGNLQRDESLFPVQLIAHTGTLSCTSGTESVKMTLKFERIRFLRFRLLQDKTHTRFQNLPFFSHHESLTLIDHANLRSYARFPPCYFPSNLS